MTPENACIKAKEAGGGPTALAQALGGLTPQAVSQWRVIPPERALKVEEVTGISRHDLREDIFGPKPEVAA